MGHWQFVLVSQLSLDMALFYGMCIQMCQKSIKDNQKWCIPYTCAQFENSFVDDRSCHLPFLGNTTHCIFSTTLLPLQELCRFCPWDIIEGGKEHPLTDIHAITVTFSFQNPSMFLCTFCHLLAISLILVGSMEKEVSPSFMRFSTLI